jgi:microcystin-dependent protein
MGITAKWDLRYPELTDPANVPLDIRDLAEDAENNALPRSGTLGARTDPAAERIGLTYYATDTGQYSVWSGSVWVDIPTGVGVGAFPGVVVATARSTAPTGWLLCDGSAISRTTFAVLFAAIGTTYGAGDGSTTFNLPDMRGRVPVGVDGAAGRLSANDGLGQSSGAQTHLLTIAEMPAHDHPNVGGGAGPYIRNTTTTEGLTGTSPTTLADEVSTVETQGGGAAHNNMPPYQVVHYVIKT